MISLSLLRSREGKTRMIVPMLILQLTKSANSSSSLVRLNFLSHLLCEGLEYMEETLCAGLLNVRLGEFPFNRDVQLDSKRAATMLEYFRNCAQDGTAIFQTPESRCSLFLKRDEMALSEAAESCSIDKVLGELERFPVKDIIDESDELLKHKYQLVYAYGDRLFLPALSARCSAIRACLDAMQDDGVVRALLLDSRLAAVRAEETPESFLAELRLLPGSALDKARPKLVLEIATSVIEHPPRDLVWLDKLDSDERAAALSFMLDASEGIYIVKKFEKTKRGLFFICDLFLS